MKVLKVKRVTLFVLLAIAVLGSITYPPVLAQDRGAKQSDEEFVRATLSGQTAAAGALLDDEFTWTDSDGHTFDKAKVLESLPKVGSADDATDATERAYGSVVPILSSQGKTHVLRIWVNRPDGWRLLVYHEVTQKAEPP